MNLNDYITRHLHGGSHEWLFEAEVEPIGETWTSNEFELFERPQGPQWSMREEFFNEPLPKRMPRVVPPEHERPGVKGHSLIKRMLREWL